ncbi:hypothetical protein Bca4012_067440 [Brassica carinata]|uniref:Uncharacterized protein n=1 Tax=Brassica carinata TaxID=52824 RepID=A0A8X7VS94_BRACI|nr:hypothetical protein Bca52824_019701 [Brassica carinata]
MAHEILFTQSLRRQIARPDPPYESSGHRHADLFSTGRSVARMSLQSPFLFHSFSHRRMPPLVSPPPLSLP